MAHPTTERPSLLPNLIKQKNMTISATQQNSSGTQQKSVEQHFPVEIMAFLSSNT